MPATEPNEPLRCPSCHNAIPSGGDEKHGTIATFLSTFYLNNPDCIAQVVEISRTWEGRTRNSLAGSPLAQFQQLSAAEIKTIPEVDAYGISTDCVGTLGRTHMVKADDLFLLNPPPPEHKCESCHDYAGPLRKHFQTSKVDKATVPAWICCNCESLTPEKRGIRF